MSSPLSPLSLSLSSILYNPSQMYWDAETLPRSVALLSHGDINNLHLPFREKMVWIPRVSVCELEADALASDVLNQHELSLGNPSMET